MVERSLRGMKIGANSLESDIGVAFVDRRDEKFRCSNGHTFLITLAADAEAPQVWECKCGAEAKFLGTETEDEEKKIIKPARTHWDMLLERRSEEELQELLAERIKLLRSGKLHTRRH